MSMAKVVFVVALAASVFGAETIPGAGNGLVAHEWGTFTSVANANGEAMLWTPLAGPADLPCFVIRSGFLAKAGIEARVRMETPVIYFYTARPTDVWVDVTFQGAITEWYPQAIWSPSNHLIWRNVEVLPNERPEFPRTEGASHYYAARETDSAALRAGGQVEKMLFYRGIADFQVPATPTFTAGGAVEVRQRVAAVLFENRDGRIGYRTGNGPGVIAAPELNGDAAGLRTAIERLLTDAGLYPKEARAMVETWSDSWFTEGMRLFYIAPREFVDRVLPVRIAPEPREFARVFVGRVELLSPAMRSTIGRAMAEGDTAALAPFGRFVTAFASQIGVGNGRTWAYLRAEEESAQRQIGSAACVK